MKRPLHILRFGTVGDKNHIGRAVNIFDNLVINANSAAYVSGAIAKLIVEKLYNNEKKGYFIDPITYAFQKDIHLLKNKEGVIKKSISKLIEKYDIELSIHNKNAFRILELDNDSLRKFCTNVLGFQYKIIQEFISSDNMSEYLIYDTNTSLDDITQIHPKLLIAPYFYLDISDNDYKLWLKLNVDCISISKKISGSYKNLPIFAQIVLSQTCLTDTARLKEIIETYALCECDGFTIWIDGLDEHKEDVNTLLAFTELLQQLKSVSERKPIYNMYGSYFSVLLTHKDVNLLDGVSHGLEYGESRDVYPVGGGLPVSKYYFMPLHKRFDFTKAFYLLSHNKIIDSNSSDWGTTDKYMNEICNCGTCSKVLKKEMSNFIKFESNQFYEVKYKNGAAIRRKKASPETKQNCLYHYLLCKNTEYRKLNKSNIEDILKELLIERDKYIDCRYLDSNELLYINNWNVTIRNIINRVNKYEW